NGVEIRQNKGTDIYSTLEKTIGFARIDQPETFYRKSCLDAIGLLNSDLHYVMDRDWWIRYLLLFGLNGIEKTNDILVNFRSHPSSKTNNYLQRFDEEAHNVYYSIARQHQLPEQAIFEKLWNLQEIKNVDYKTSLNQPQLQSSIHYYLLQLAFIAYAKNNYNDAKKIIKSIQTNFLSKDDIAQLNSVKNRIKYLPIWLKKLLNKR
ncbi:MAG: hypothetical protein KDD21_10570, partial [Bacteroidetes bacterium]|nr:hypothetical protein [Bacteroidota bacterium]